MFQVLGNGSEESNNLDNHVGNNCHDVPLMDQPLIEPEPPVNQDEPKTEVKLEVKETNAEEKKVNSVPELKRQNSVKIEPEVAKPEVEKPKQADVENELADLLEDQRKNQVDLSDIFTTGDSDDEKRKTDKKAKKDKRRDSLQNDAKKPKKSEKKNKKNKIRKLSSEENPEEKKKRKKKHSDCDSPGESSLSLNQNSEENSESNPNMASRKISEISSGSPPRPSQSVSSESDLLSPDHRIGLQIYGGMFFCGRSFF